MPRLLGLRHPILHAEKEDKTYEYRTDTGELWGFPSPCGYFINFYTLFYIITPAETVFLYRFR